MSKGIKDGKYFYVGGAGQTRKRGLVNIAGELIPSTDFCRQFILNLSPVFLNVDIGYHSAFLAHARTLRLA